MCGGTSRMTRECQVRIGEGLGAKFPGSTRQFPGPTRQKRLLPQRNLVVRSSSMSGLPTHELGGLCLHRQSGVIDIDRYQINMRLHLYLNRRSLWLGKQSDVRGLRQMLKSLAKKKTSAGRIAKSLKRTVGAYETESILSWGFVRFSRIGKSSFSFRRNLPDHTAVKAVSRSAISGEHR